MKTEKFKKYEWTLKLLELTGAIRSRDDVKNVVIVVEGGLTYYELERKIEDPLRLSVIEVNELMCRYMVASNIVIPSK